MRPGPTITGLLMLVLIGAADSARAQGTNWNDVRKNNQGAIVFLHGEFLYSNGFPETTSGTGFLVHEDGWILTCAHVVPAEWPDGSQPTYWASIGGRGEQRRSFVVKKRDPIKDLALLLLSPQPAEPLPFVQIDFNRHLANDQSVYALGFPAANYDGLDGTPGYISSRLEESWLTTASINPGSSGGPVFSSDGRVVGVARGALPNSNLMNVVVPIRLAKVWLDEIPGFPPHVPVQCPEEKWHKRLLCSFVSCTRDTATLSGDLNCSKKKAQGYCAETGRTSFYDREVGRQDKWPIVLFRCSP